ncbi:MAG: ATP-grasp domain-containing protein, partial [Elusimicrobia bacterium]|nr:ATP-grasp domain-containing protein [Elusimicrobiota bacterium]
GAVLKTLGIAAPPFGVARNRREALAAARRVGYPVIVRPSYVLGGRAMEVVYDDAGLSAYSARAFKASEHPELFIDRFLSDAVEVDVDAVSDGRAVFVAGVMEHIEEAGVHSGDSACTLPPHSITPGMVERIKTATRRLARELKVVGMMNLQFAIKDGVLYLLEANPRASRTVPFVSKATGLPLAKLAAKAIAGERLKDLLPAGLLKDGLPELPYAATKEVVLPFIKFPGTDPMLGPEMKSTGEVMGIDSDFPRSFAKSQSASGQPLPVSGLVFISVRDEDKPHLLAVAGQLRQMGFELVATRNTHAFLSRHGIEARTVYKLGEGKPDVVDLIKQRNLALVINTPSGRKARADGFNIRRTSLDFGVPIVTNMNSCQAVVRAVSAMKGARLEVKALQDLYPTLPYKVN